VTLQLQQKDCISLVNERMTTETMPDEGDSHTVDLEARKSKSDGSGGTETKRRDPGAVLTLKNRIFALIQPEATRRDVVETAYESVEKYRSLVESSGFGIATVDFKGRFTFVNKALCRMSGYSEKELLGKHFAAFLHSQDKQRIMRIFLSAWRKPSRSPSIEFRVVHKSGKTVHMFSTPTLYTLHGRIRGFNAIIADITSIKQMEDTIRSLARLPAENPFPILRLSNKGEILYSNNAAQTMLKNLHGRIPQHLRDACFKAMKNNSVLNVDAESGGRIFSCYVTPIPDSCYVNIYAIDVTGSREAEKAILENQEKFERLFLFNPEAAVYADIKDCVLDVNPRFSELFGYSADEAKGKSLDDLIVPENLRAEARKLAEVTDGVYHDTVRQSKRGKLIPVSISSASIVCDGRHLGDIVLYKDITERKREQAALLENKQKFERLFRNMPDAAVYWDKNFRVLEINPRFTELFGYTIEEAKGKPNTDLIVPKDKLHEASELWKKAQNGYIDHDTVRKRKDGSLVDVSMSAAPVTVDEVLIGYTGLYKDISERKRMEETLRESEENYRGLFENARDIIATLDTSGIVTSVNQRIEHYGYRKDDIVGKNMRQFVAKKHWPRLFAALMRIVRGTPVEGELDMIAPIGRVTVEYRSNPIRHNGKVVGLQTSLRDVTERKKADEALKTEEKRFRDVVSSTGDWVWEVDTTGRYTYASPAVEQLLGFRPKEVLGRHFYDFFISEERNELKDAAFRAFAQKQPFTHFVNRNLDKNGQIVTIETSGVPIISGNGKLVGYRGVDHDITERKKMEEQLKNYSERLEELVQERSEELLESEKRFSVLVEEASEGVLITQDGKLLFINKKGAEIFRLSRNELIGLPVEQAFRRMMSEESWRLLSAKHEQAKLDHIPIKACEAEYRDENGNKIQVEFSSTLVNYRGRPGFFCIFRDIRERKRLEEQHLKLEKMATVGELATMVAHDLRNPLTAIRNASFFLKSSCENLRSKEGETLLEMADLIEQEIIYANSIINDLLDFAAKRPLQKKVQDINRLLKEFLKKNRMPENINLDTSFRAKTPLPIDDKPMERVFFNLLENAVQAMPQGGVLSIKTRESDCGIELTFADTGVGIPKANMGKLFQPLFTTKAKGIGMGLAICKRIIEQHGGIITVRSRAGRGTSFTIKLPK